MNSNLSGQVGLVTGASSGIGRAISLALAHHGVQLCLIGRKPANLAKTVEAVRPFTKAVGIECDLNRDGVEPLRARIGEEFGRLDILIHSAGVIHQAPMQCATAEDFDTQYATNVRTPYFVTQCLLPLLICSRGQIVFINSSAGLSAKRPEAGQYAATKHALRAIADSLREEVNVKGIRVLTLYVGRTATPMQHALMEQEGQEYRPETLLQPEDVASVLVHALTLPHTAEVTDISIRPMCKALHPKSNGRSTLFTPRDSTRADALSLRNRS
jgi:NAD(P)-dependent dehydrogenase (short-subunit alcohol dehydrogenase family)